MAKALAARDNLDSWNSANASDHPHTLYGQDDAPTLISAETSLPLTGLAGENLPAKLLDFAPR